jgi:ketosteroid isomerase-like protein
MTIPADAIAARRKLTNRLIAGKDARRLAPFFAPDTKVIVGDGSLLMGAAEVIAAFDAQFSDPDFITYVRSGEGIEIDSAGLRAAERGRWVGSWKGTPDQSGSYLATWKKVTGQWVIESELYVTLDRGD